MERRKNDRYGMIFVDAFSSDSIPVHLLTREAMNLYFDRLKPDGILVLHISNRYLKLKPVVAKLVEDLKLAALAGHDRENKGIDKFGSDWVAVARRSEDLDGLRKVVCAVSEWYDDLDTAENARERHALGAVAGGMAPLLVRRRWVELEAKPDDPLWEDDFSNLLKIVDWR
jgi:hypothetical protein